MSLDPTNHDRASAILARVPDAPPAPDGGDWVIITDPAVLAYADRLNALCRDIARRNPQLFAAVVAATPPPADHRAAHGLPPVGAHQPAASVVAAGDGESGLLPLPSAGGALAPGLPASVDCGPVERAAD